MTTQTPQTPQPLSAAQALQLAYDTMQSMLAMRRPDLLAPEAVSPACLRVSANGGTGSYLAQSLAAVAAAQQHLASQEALQASTHAPDAGLPRTLQRWNVMEGSALPLANEPTYEVQVIQGAHQVHVRIAPAGQDAPETTPALSLGIEINHGLPCVHLHGGGADELQASVYGLPEGGVGFRQGDAGPIGNMVVFAHTDPDVQAVADFMAQSAPLASDASAPLPA